MNAFRTFSMEEQDKYVFFLKRFIPIHVLLA